MLLSQLLKRRLWVPASQVHYQDSFVANNNDQSEGTAQPSFIHTLLESNSQKEANGEPIVFDNDDIKGAAGAIYAAGQDTVSETQCGEA